MATHRWHSSLGKLGAAGLNSDINVTPLVDVCLVLLIIFMVVTPMLQKGVPVNLPITDAPEKTPDTEKLSMRFVTAWRVRSQLSTYGFAICDSDRPPKQ